MVGGRVRRRIGALAVGVLAMTVVAGCATAIGGTAVSARQSGATKSARPGASASATPRESNPLGDPTTVDPCSLTDVGALSEFGKAELAAPDSLDECLVKIKTDAPEPIELYVGSLDRVESYPDLPGKKSTELPGGLKVVDYEPGSGFYCTQLLVFPDGITLSVNGSVYDKEEPKLCEMVKAGMDKVVEILRDGDVEHRDFARNSLGRVDPCAITPAAAVHGIPELGSVKPKTYPARHTCSWTAASNNVRVRVMFGVGAPPRPAAGAGETPIAGRASVLQPTPEAGNYAFCAALTGHIGFRADGHEDLVEIATVFVRMQKGQVDAACKAAMDVATAVWPKLPKP